MNNLKSYFPNYLTSGAIFSQMKDAPWLSIAPQMDIAYISMWSGDKSPSNMVIDLSTNGIANSEKLADILWSLYGKNWLKLWNGLLADYNPIHNYDITEDVTRELSNNRNIDRSIDETGSVNSTDNGLVKTVEDGTIETNTTGTSKTTNSSTQDVTEEETTTVEFGKIIDSTSEEDDYTYGFNSPEKVPTTVITKEGQDKESGSDTTTRNLTGKTVTSGEEDVATTGASDTSTNNNRTVNSSDTVDTFTTDKTTDTTQDDQKLTENITRERYGTTGQFSYQDLLLKEFELWKWTFFKQVFADCDFLLTLPIFNTCFN